LLALSAAGVFAQSTQGAAGGQAATIKVETTLVMIPTVATDKSGKRISDLKEEDFEVLREGKVQKIGLFRHVETKAEVMKPAAAPTNAVTNVVESSPGRLTIFVIDFLNSTLTEQRTAREQMLQFL
jgi:VWFA-related protein